MNWKLVKELFDELIGALNLKHKHAQCCKGGPCCAVINREADNINREYYAGLRELTK